MFQICFDNFKEFGNQYFYKEDGRGYICGRLGSLEKVQNEFREDYWDSIQLDNVKNDKIALILFETAIVCGVEVSMKHLQDCLNDCGKGGEIWKLLPITSEPNQIMFSLLDTVLKVAGERVALNGDNKKTKVKGFYYPKIIEGKLKSTFVDAIMKKHLREKKENMKKDIIKKEYGFNLNLWILHRIYGLK